jgi:type IV secretory pathway protease TraF
MRWHQQLLMHVVTSLGLAIGWVSIERHLVWNITPSMPTGLYWYWPGADVQEGDIVFFTPPDVWLEAMAHLQGEALRNTPIVKRIHTLTPATMVVWGEHRHSLDSRTLGPVPRTRIIGRGWPLWTKPVPREER